MFGIGPNGAALRLSRAPVKSDWYYRDQRQDFHRSFIRSYSHRRGKTGLLGTIANRLGAKELTASLTTPESVDLQGFLAEMVRQECSYVIMEVSSHALALSRVLETEFDIGILTNLTGDHLDFIGILKNIEKQRDFFFSSWVREKRRRNMPY